MVKSIYLAALLYIFSASSFADVAKAVAAFNDRNYSLASELLTQLDDSTYQKHLYLAQIEAMNGEFDKAKELIEKALSINSTDADGHFTYAEVMAKCAENAGLFSIKGYIKKVKKGFETAVRLAPENIIYRRALIRFHLNAPGFLGGDLDDALKHANTLTEQNQLYGKSAQLHVYGQMKDKPNFKRVLKVLSDNYSDEPEMHYQLGLYYQNKEQYEVATDHYRKAAGMNAKTTQQEQSKYRALFNIGYISTITEKNIKEAEKSTTQYLQEAPVAKHMPDKSLASFQLANLAEIKGQTERAIGIYTQLLAGAATVKLKKEVKERIKKLR